jgi:type I restriction enzyme M protein
MGYIFEELIRRFSEASNETAGDHFTPREVIRLMVNLLFFDDSEALTKKGVIRTLYDPAAGTKGVLSVAQNYLREFNRNATLKVIGQSVAFDFRDQPRRCPTSPNRVPLILFDSHLLAYARPAS